MALFPAYSSWPCMGRIKYIFEMSFEYFTWRNLFHGIFGEVMSKPRRFVWHVLHDCFCGIDTKYFNFRDTCLYFSSTFGTFASFLLKYYWGGKSRCLKTCNRQIFQKMGFQNFQLTRRKFSLSNRFFVILEFCSECIQTPREIYTFMSVLVSHSICVWVTEFKKRCLHTIFWYCVYWTPPKVIGARSHIHVNIV